MDTVKPSHAAQRLQERVSALLDNRHVNAIAEMIRDGNYLYVLDLRNHKKIVRVFLDGRCVYVIYNSSQKRVVTILTNNMLQKALQKQEALTWEIKGSGKV